MCMKDGMNVGRSYDYYYKRKGMVKRNNNSQRRKNKVKTTQ